jgi:D-amino-acid dehydrogenase
MDRVDVAIIGGGIVGVAAAAELARAGASVTLLEQGRDVAAAASGRNAGLVLEPPDPVMAALYRDSLAMYRSITGTALPDGRAFALPAQEIAMLGLSADVDLMRRLAAGVGTELIDGPALRTLEPMVADDLVAVPISRGYPARPADATQAFASIARTLRVQIRCGGAARPWVENRVALGVELASGERIAAAAVLVAAGWWTSALVDPTGGRRPVQALWGLLVEMAMPAPPRHVLEEITAEDSMNLSHTGDEPLFTLNPAPLEPPPGRGPDPAIGNVLSPTEPDPVRLGPRLVEHARRFLPSLDDAWVRGTRVCPRPGSFDGRPLVGFIPWIERLAVAAGNGAWGISTGPATGALAARAVLDRTDAPIPAALRASRRPGLSPTGVPASA